MSHSREVIEIYVIHSDNLKQKWRLHLNCPAIVHNLHFFTENCAMMKWMAVPENARCQLSGTAQILLTVYAEMRYNDVRRSTLLVNGSVYV